MCRYTRIKGDGQLRRRNCQNPKIIMEWKIKLDLQIFAIDGMMTKFQMARIIKLHLPPFAINDLKLKSQNKNDKKNKNKITTFGINDMRKKRAKIRK